MKFKTVAKSRRASPTVKESETDQEINEVLEDIPGKKGFPKRSEPSVENDPGTYRVVENKDSDEVV